MASAPRARVIEALRNSVLLDVLPDDALSLLAGRTRYRTYAANELIFRREDEGATLFVLLSGRIKISALGPSGAEIILNIIEPGDVFGEMSLLDGAPRCADAVAAARSETVSLDRADFLPVLDEHPEAARKMMGILCERIRQTTAFVESAVLLSAPARLFLRIRAMSEQFGIRKRDGTIRIAHGFTQQELADSVGLTRVSVNRYLMEWRRAGLIEYRRGVMEVHDLDALSARADSGNPA